MPVGFGPSRAASIRCTSRGAVDGSLLTFTNDCAQSLQALEHRGGRHPVRAHAVAVVASRRLHSNAQAGVARQNSLRALRALRSNNCREFDHEARCARDPDPALLVAPEIAPTGCQPPRARRGRGVRACFEINPTPLTAPTKRSLKFSKEPKPAHRLPLISCRTPAPGAQAHAAHGGARRGGKSA